jgi:arylsulfatase A-like enzyme
MARLLLAALLLGSPEAERPNFVFILADDLGAMDLRDTPQLDRLAARGTRFAQAYSACTVCSPTRASLLTGKHPARLRITDWIPGHVRPNAKLRVPDWTQRLPLEETTIAEVLREAGYATASIGKWHLGGPALYPEKQGFDLNVAGTDKGQPPSYFAPWKIPTLPEGKDGEYVTDRLTDEALKFIEANRERPFFLYLPHFAVHTPLQAKPGLVEKHKAKAGPRNPVYAAMIESLDEGVGRIVAKLDELKLSGKTVVVFSSDNGGLVLRDITSNAPLRAGKGSAYEGGVRVPAIVSWPGKVAAGAVRDTPVITPDWFATFVELAGLPRRNVDGVSLAPLLLGQGEPAPRPLFWHYPHYHPGGATPHSAVRDGDWRLVEFFEDGRTELFNLKDDVGEAKDLAASMPEKAAELRKKLADWRTSVDAQVPTPNPDFKPK